MNLHRASKKPDWQQIEPKSLSTVQKIAAKTRGVITPANVISLIGLGLVFYGLGEILYGQLWLGLVFLAVGRLLDIVDGLVAEATKTKSLLGEAVDAVVDKLGTLGTIAVLFMLNIAPWWIIMALLIPQVLAPVIAYHKKRQGKLPHPTRSGKLGMATAWVGITGLLLIKLIGPQMVITIPTYLSIGLSLIFGVRALWVYAKGRD